MIATLSIPVIFISITIFCMLRGVKVFDAFTEGARQGLQSVFRIIPSILGLVVASSVFRASGAMDWFAALLHPIAKLLGIPSGVLPLALLRPVSGSASLALLEDIMKNYGPDSLEGITASAVMGSTETVFYTVAVYFGAVNIKKVRYTIAAALFADVTGLIAAAFFTKLLVGFDK